MVSSSIRFVCCRKHSKTKSTGCSHGAPRAFPIVLLESMRLLYRLTDGKAVKSASSTKDSNVSEEVSGVSEPWTRLRAFFTTLAFSINQKDWFGFWRM